MSCTSAFEAEALRDDSLSPERASSERHLVTCAECRAEVDALANLAAEARASRLAILRAFVHELTPRRPDRVVSRGSSPASPGSSSGSPPAVPSRERSAGGVGRSSAAAEYRVAVEKLEAGDDRATAAAFERFAAEYPNHVNAEDALYLRVVALQHAGDRTAAGAYLPREGGSEALYFGLKSA